MARKRPRKRSHGDAQRGMRQLAEQLAEVEELMKQQRWDEADALLDKLEQRHPRQPLILRMRLTVAAARQDMVQQREILERLVRLEPNDPGPALMLAAAYQATGRIALAQRALHKFLQRWPGDEGAAEARQHLEAIEKLLGAELQSSGLGTGPHGLELAAQHEQAMTHLERNELAAAVHVAEQLLKARPDFVPARNNLAEAYFRQGHYAQAIEQARLVLAAQPGNVHALGNLTRFLVLAGRADEAASVAERLRAARPADPEQWAKVAEALSILGDDAGVLEAVAAWRASGTRALPEAAALLEHLAAVAACRQGREDAARASWRKALQSVPGYPLARTNLDDLDQPVGERHAPWPYPLSFWLPQALFEKLVYRVKSRRGQKDENVRKEVRGFLQAHPEVECLAPLLLDRGDPGGRTFALGLALQADTPALQAALRDFALGQRGPDEQRLEAARVAQRAGLLTSPVRLWIRGEWAEHHLLDFELTFEPENKHTPQVRKLAQKANDHLTAGNGVEAERLLRQGLAQEPDAPDLHNNLAMALEVQGRRSEAHAMIRQIHTRFPDYWFGKVGVAQLLTKEGKLDEAEAILKPLRAVHQLHASEFAALAMAMIDLLLARNFMDGARSWLRIWEDQLPDHYALDSYRDRIERSSGRRRWLS
jgi:predicted Zn-dependent protease